MHATLHLHDDDKSTLYPTVAKAYPELTGSTLLNVGHAGIWFTDTLAMEALIALLVRFDGKLDLTSLPAAALDTVPGNLAVALTALDHEGRDLDALAAIATLGAATPAPEVTP